VNDLMKQLDTLLKPVNDALKNMPAGQLIRYVAIYSLIAGIVNLCGSVLLLVGGAVVGLGAAAGAASVAATGAGNQGAAAVAAAGGVGGLLLITGILYLIVGPALIIVALGLFRRMGWARMGAVFAMLASAVLSLLSLLSGGGILNLVWLLGGLYLAYFFYSDAGIKKEFGQA
jgi:hypothetical protein